MSPCGIGNTCVTSLSFIHSLCRCGISVALVLGFSCLGGLLLGCFQSPQRVCQVLSGHILGSDTEWFPPGSFPSSMWFCCQHDRWDVFYILHFDGFAYICFQHNIKCLWEVCSFGWGKILLANFCIELHSFWYVKFVLCTRHVLDLTDR